MKLKINKDKCLGCGMCVSINNDVFNFEDDGLANVNNQNITDLNIEEVKEAKNSCPVSAIEEINENLKD